VAPRRFELVRHILDHAGYEALLIPSSDGAADLIRANQPAAVMLDLWLEDRESGVRLLEQLGDNEQTRPVPVIICTASTDELQSRRPGLQNEGYYRLAKPFDLNGLLNLLANVIDRP
jgi:DNA-binding response OmpR family regulator